MAHVIKFLTRKPSDLRCHYAFFFPRTTFTKPSLLTNIIPATTPYLALHRRLKRIQNISPLNQTHLPPSIQVFHKSDVMLSVVKAITLHIRPIPFPLSSKSSQTELTRSCRPEVVHTGPFSPIPHRPQAFVLMKGGN